MRRPAGIRKQRALVGQAASRRAAAHPHFSSALHSRLLVAALVLSLGLPLLFALPSCSSKKEPARPVRLATTTSTANTGLLDYLFKAYKEETGVEVQFIAVGTGKALKHGENGDVDLLLVHAPAAEEEFVAKGFGLARVPVMWNDFVIAGPPEDPAGLGALQGTLGAAKTALAADALHRLADARAPFVSRADDSGTHKKEMELWSVAGVKPTGSWYMEAGQGMEECLVIANEKRGYVLSDRGTLLSRPDLRLSILIENDPVLMNPYSLIVVNPARYPDLNTRGAQRLIEWMTSPRGQKLIDDFRVNDRPLFHPGEPPVSAPATVIAEPVALAR